MEVKISINRASASNNLPGASLAVVDASNSPNKRTITYNQTSKNTLNSSNSNLQLKDNNINCESLKEITQKLILFGRNNLPFNKFRIFI